MTAWTERLAIFHTTIVLLSSLVLQVACGYGTHYLKRQNGDNFTIRFFNRERHSSIVLGNFLYIHGGEFTTWNGTGNVTTIPNDFTYSIDLSTSWTNDTVELTSIQSQAPTLIYQALWKDLTNDSFYAYDGGKSYSEQLADQPKQPPNQLWQFTPSGNSGSWSLVGPTPSSNFSTLIRSYVGIYTSGGSLGFALGGIQNAATNPDIQSQTYDTSGMVMYNFTSQDWYNISASGYSLNGYAQHGAAHFVPSFGPSGLVLVLGGYIGNSTLIGLDTISMFEPISQQWSAQVASGKAPPPILDPCMVGIQGDNDTYEIFVYGGVAGSSANQTVEQGAVHVLSLPAFNWQKQNITPEYGRYAHSCNIIGHRQMVSIGGIVNNKTASDTFVEPGIADPWTQGIGVFDLTAMQWKTSYDPNAAPYITPDAVKAYYAQNGRYPASWSKPVIGNWFTNPGPVRANANTTSPTSPPSESSGSHAGAIAGGTVGGVVAVALFTLLAFFLLRRRRRNGRITANKSDHEYRKPELGIEDVNKGAGTENEREVPSEMPGNAKPIEMAQREAITSELPHRERYEI